jgi:hypothetical protein
MVAPINQSEFISSVLLQAQNAYEAAEARAARIYAEVLASFKITNASSKIVSLKKPEPINAGLLKSYLAYKLN